jgi:hypothetical protein
VTNDGSTLSTWWFSSLSDSKPFVLLADMSEVMLLPKKQLAKDVPAKSAGKRTISACNP